MASGHESGAMLVEFVEHSPRFEPVDREPTSADLDRWAARLEPMLEADEPETRLNARRRMTTICVRRIERMLRETIGANGSAVAGDAAEQLRELRGRTASQDEFDALVDALALATGLEDAVETVPHPPVGRHSSLMASRFGPPLKLLRGFVDALQGS